MERGDIHIKSIGLESLDVGSITEMGEPDELYTLRNLFWLGNYQLAINEANGIRGSLSVPLGNEKKEFLYRSYLALGQYDIVTSEIAADAPAGRFSVAN